MSDDKKRKEPTGRAKGAVALAESMTPEQLRARAQKGAAARWGKVPVASHKGNFKDELGVDVECYVLNDAMKTAVISQTGMARALGMASRGSVFPRFISSQAMAPYVGIELEQKLQNPLVFQLVMPGIGGSISANGFDATLLIDVCNAIASANAAGALSKRYDKIVQQAAVITGAAAKSGIRGFVYALAGYNPSAEEVIQAFKLYVQEEAKKYEAEFPNELYSQWQRLYKIPLPERGKPWQFMHLTRRHIYFPLAKSNGKIYELVKALKAKDGDQKKKLFQFLNEVGARALRIQIGRVLEMSESSTGSQEYEAKIIARFGGQQELELVVPTPP